MVRSSFIDVEGVSLRVRTAGQGPAMLLIHQAPISARTMESRIERLKKDFFCLAPDLPGLGESDELTGGLVTVERLARTILGLLARLGIERVVAYGQHTGALVATELAIVAPERVAGVLIGGFPIYTTEESAQRVTTYAPPLAAPDWSGGHLSWLWYRYREQFVYWPWNSKEPRIRATCAIPSTQFLQAGAAEIAARHASYAAIYHAAFDYDAEGALRRVKVPLHFILDLADSLSLKIELAAAANPALRRWHAPTAEIEATEHRVALEVAHGLPVVSADLSGSASERRVDLVWDRGAVRLWRLNAGAGRPCLIMPPFPAGPRAILPEVAHVLDRELLLTEFLELPEPGREAEWVDGFGRAIRPLIADSGLCIAAAGGACAVASALFVALGEKARQLVLLDQDDRGDGTPFDPTLCSSGGHLLRLWDRLRFERMRPPRATPDEPSSVRGRYESLDVLGRYSWDAVGNIALVPAWDNLVAALAESEERVAGMPGVTTVATGIDRRGSLLPADRSARAAVQLPGIADAPFASAIALLGT